MWFNFHMNTTKQTTAPAPFLARIRDEAPARRSQITCRPGANRSDVYTAGDLADLIGDGVVWEFSGHVRGGRELWSRTRFVADAEGALHCYAANGQKVIVHPADRQLRILTH